MSFDNKSQSLISVVIPTYNHGEFIGEAVRAVLDQTYQHFEIIIIDNYSEDDTENIVNSFNDRRITYIKFMNNGIIASSRNKGVGMARGDLIAFLDSDDLWMKNKLETVVSQFKKSSAVDLICHDELVETKNSKTISTYGPHTSYRELLFEGNCISTSAIVVRRQKIIDAGGFSEDMRFIGVEDYDCWLRLARNGCRIEYLHEVLGVYRVFGQGLTNNVRQHNQNGLNVINAHFFEWNPQNLFYRCLMSRRRAMTLRSNGHVFMKRGDHREANRLFVKAVREYPLSWKCWVLFFLNILRVKL